MKRIFQAIMALLVVSALASCGGNSETKVTEIQANVANHPFSGGPVSTPIKSSSLNGCIYKVTNRGTDDYRVSAIYYNGASLNTTGDTVFMFAEITKLNSTAAVEFDESSDKVSFQTKKSGNTVDSVKLGIKLIKITSPNKRHFVLTGGVLSSVVDNPTLPGDTTIPIGPIGNIVYWNQGGTTSSDVAIGLVDQETIDKGTKKPWH